MIYNNVEEIYQSIDKTREILIAKAESLNDEQMNSREDGEGWSVAEIVEHIGIVEGGMLKIIEKLLGEAEKAGNKSTGEFNPPISFEKYAEAAKDQKFQAPERVYPQGGQNIKESLVKLSQNRLALHNLKERIKAVDSSQTGFPHPAFGNLNLYEWLAFIGLHEIRHLQQIKRILK